MPCDRSLATAIGIAARRAAVLAYITNQLLRTLPAIAKEENAEPTQIILDMQMRNPGRDKITTESGQPS